MNRLWIWISALIVGVILIVALVPVAYRTVSQIFGLSPRPSERLPLDQNDPGHFREVIERRVWTNLFRTMAVGAVFGLIAGVLLTRNLVAPLRQLEQGANALSRHQFDYRVPVKGSIEMRSVALAFNQMAVELENQETLRRKLLADVTHELRHPIHILQGSLQAILDNVYKLDMDEINRLLEQTQNLAILVDELHELALAEARDLSLEKEEVDLRNLVSTATEAYQSLVIAKSLELKVMLPDQPVFIQVDEARIRQVLQNLLSNAIRYTPANGIITIVLSTTLEIAKIRVEDTGSGIKPENLPRVFDRFYQEDSSRNRQHKGTGLGLAIAQAIVQAHGGEISVSSPGINQGSRFTITLPFNID
jgi:signal transduction histidine kinase